MPKQERLDGSESSGGGVSKRQKVLRPKNEPSDSEDEIPEYLCQDSVHHPKFDERFYLDTIDRQKLDFDFEKVCLITLLNVNVYGCLVCGKFFQGRSPNSPAYLHSVTFDHRVFIHLETGRVYALPDNVELKSPTTMKSLRDIQVLLDPRYEKEEIANLSNQPITAYDLNQRGYSVGYVGLNNISANDYANVVIQCLSHIPKIRNYYLGLSLAKNHNIYHLVSRKSTLNSRFGLVIRKIWSSHLFKNHISPHEFLQYVANVTKKKFGITNQESPKKFMTWLLNQLHLQLVKATAKKTSVLSNSLQGNVRVTKLPLKTFANKENNTIAFDTDQEQRASVVLKFWMLSLDLPTNSVFKGSLLDQDQIPQVSIQDLLKKYDGKTRVQISATELKSYRLVEPLPPYLVIHIDRGIEEKEDFNVNPTVVKFPKILDMSEYIEGESKDNLNYRLISSIKLNVVTGSKLDRSDDKLKWSIDLLKDKLNDLWVSINDLQVEDCDSELLFLQNNYIQVWERC